MHIKYTHLTLNFKIQKKEEEMKREEYAVAHKVQVKPMGFKMKMEKPISKWLPCQEAMVC